MTTDVQKFSSQARSDVLNALKNIAKEEGRQFQSLLEEAMQDLIDKKRGAKPRAHVISALHESVLDFDSLYDRLAK